MVAAVDDEDVYRRALLEAEALMKQKLAEEMEERKKRWYFPSNTIGPKRKLSAVLSGRLKRRPNASSWRKKNATVVANCNGKRLPACRPSLSRSGFYSRSAWKRKRRGAANGKRSSVECKKPWSRSRWNAIASDRKLRLVSARNGNARKERTRKLRQSFSRINRLFPKCNTL